MNSETRMNTCPRDPSGQSHGRQSGFSRIEVMVALVVCSIGLLGLAKMESLALSSEDVSGNRTIAAIEAASLASMMHANRGYWASTSVTAGATVTWSGTAVVVSDPTLALVAPCLTPAAGACSPAQIAAYDVQNWGGQTTTQGTTTNVGLASLIPGYTATITCTPTVTVSPVTCIITIQWPENAVAANTQQQSNLTALALATNPSYTLNVEP
jgi:type IV pilus assembly protein PilV